MLVHQRVSTSPKKVDGLSHSSRSAGYWPPDTTDTAGWMTDTAGRRFFRTRDVVELMPEGDLVGDGCIPVHPSNWLPSGYVKHSYCHRNSGFSHEKNGDVPQLCNSLPEGISVIS